LLGRFFGLQREASRVKAAGLFFYFDLAWLFGGRGCTPGFAAAAAFAAASAELLLECMKAGGLALATGAGWTWAAPAALEFCFLCSRIILAALVINPSH
jgi:hypothetical protein